MHTPGLNIEFKHNNLNVIGQMGFGKFNIARDCKKAYCPHFKVNSSPYLFFFFFSRECTCAF